MLVCLRVQYLVMFRFLLLRMVWIWKLNSRFVFFSIYFQCCSIVCGGSKDCMNTLIILFRVFRWENWKKISLWLPFDFLLLSFSCWLRLPLWKFNKKHIIATSIDFVLVSLLFFLNRKISKGSAFGKTFFSSDLPHRVRKEDKRMDCNA